MKDKFWEFFTGRVVLEGTGTFFFRFLEIFVVGVVITGIVQQFGG